MKVLSSSTVVKALLAGPHFPLEGLSSNTIVKTHLRATRSPLKTWVSVPAPPLLIQLPATNVDQGNNLVMAQPGFLQPYQRTKLSLGTCFILARTLL